MLVEFLLLAVVALLLFYYWSIAYKDFFKKRGLPYHEQFPLFGSMKDTVFRKKSMFDMLIELYNMNDGKVFGIFDQRNPVLMIRDPEMIKQITIKDFDHFLNHRTIFGENDSSNLFSSSLFSMQNEKWKNMRSTLSPAFTGSKMRHMYQLINQVAQDTAAYLNKEKNIKEGLELEIKDYFTRFTNDVIASTAFGLQVNSFKDKENEFYTIGKKITNFTAIQNLKFFLYGNFKYIMKLFKIELFDRKYSDYFMHLVLDAMKYRKEHNINRPDMINMLMEAKGMINTENQKAPNHEWSDVEIVAQCFIFFFAGFETASVLMCFTAHELMENPEIQQKLFEEIQDVNAQLDGKPVPYETLQNMQYLDMVVTEVLRKWPPAIAIDRLCNKDFVYEADGERIEIKKGDSIWIPLAGMHRDPKHFENPLKFDPERFNEENKEKINPFTNMPFGMGPRNCIGSRFALLEAKAMIYYLLRDFHLEAAAKTTIPLQLSPSTFQLMPKNGFWLKLRSRNKA